MNKGLIQSDIQASAIGWDRGDQKRLILEVPRHLFTVILCSAIFFALGIFSTYYFLENKAQLQTHSQVENGNLEFNINANELEKIVNAVSHSDANLITVLSKLLVEQENFKIQLKSLRENVQSVHTAKEWLLQSRIASLESTLAEARIKYTANNPKLKRLEDQLNSLLMQE